MPVKDKRQGCLTAQSETTLDRIAPEVKKPGVFRTDLAKGRFPQFEYQITKPVIAEKVEAEVRENLWKLNGGAPKAPAKAAEKAVAVSADDFDDED